MDTVYQAVKNLFKSVLNLLAAVIELLAGILDGFAGLLKWMRPKMGEMQKKAESGLVSDDVNAEGMTDKLAGWKAKAGRGRIKEDIQAEMLVNEIRNELKEKIINKESYYFFRSQTKLAGSGFYPMVVFTMLFASLMAAAVFVSEAGNGMRWVSLLLLAAVYGLTGIAVFKHRKKLHRSCLTEMILEEEVKGRVWQPVQETEPEEEEKTAVPETEDCEEKADSQRKPDSFHLIG